MWVCLIVGLWIAIFELVLAVGLASSFVICC
jgi:hypothetical protein